MQHCPPSSARDTSCLKLRWLVCCFTISLPHSICVLTLCVVQHAEQCFSVQHSLLHPRTGRVGMHVGMQIVCSTRICVVPAGIWAPQIPR